MERLLALLLAVRVLRYALPILVGTLGGCLFFERVAAPNLGWGHALLFTAVITAVLISNCRGWLNPPARRPTRPLSEPRSRRTGTRRPKP